MGKVSVGTVPCFCQWVSESRPWLQQGLELPPGAVPAAVVSHPLLHCSPVSSLVALPLLCCSQSLSRCVVEGAFLGTWPGLRWYAGFPRSPALPADLLLAHCSEREEAAARPGTELPSAWFLLSLKDMRRIVNLLWVLFSSNRKTNLVLKGKLPDDEP